MVGYTTTTATGLSIFKTTGDYGETYGDGNLNADSNASDLVLCLDFYAMQLIVCLLVDQVIRSH